MATLEFAWGMLNLFLCYTGRNVANVIVQNHLLVLFFENAPVMIKKSSIFEYGGV